MNQIFLGPQYAVHIAGSAQGCIANALEILQSCTKLSI